MSDEAPTFRNGLLSIYQSAVDDYARTAQQAATPFARSAPTARPGMEHDFVRAGVATALTRMESKTAAVRARMHPQPLSDPRRDCAELGLQYLEAAARGDRDKAAAIKQNLEFSQCDAMWIQTLDRYLKYFGPGGGLRTIPYVRAATVGSRVIDIKPGARVAVIGDWGTGTDGAVALLKDVAARNPDIVIHLGDIYYSGTATECGSYFQQILNTVLDRARTKIPIYTLSGNHDMYSGGGGYYGLLEQLNDPPQRQPASFFCLRATDQNWQFLAMDTGLHDHDPFDVTGALTYLEPDEEDWHAARIGEFPGRTILLSHHQLFSAFAQIGPPGVNGQLNSCNPLLLKSLQRFQAAAPGRVPAWLWGHEHNLCIYKTYAGLACGRCIGHGAIPVFDSETPYAVPANLADPPQLVADTQLPSDNSLFAHGYAMVTLSGATARIDYFQDTNFAQPSYGETLPLPAG
jgi:Calcineurin-like phosphoesterase